MDLVDLKTIFAQSPVLGILIGLCVFCYKKFEKLEGNLNRIELELASKNFNEVKQKVYQLEKDCRVLELELNDLAARGHFKPRRET